MATFRVGQRVRIVRSEDPLYLYKEATIWRIERDNWDRASLKYVDRAAIAYCLDVDGMGRCNRDGCWTAFPADWLAPLTNPGDEAWAADQVKKWTKPEPVVPVPQQEKERT